MNQHLLKEALSLTCTLPVRKLLPLVSVSATVIISFFSWLSAATGVLSFIIFLPGIFQETFIADKELELLKTLADKEKNSSDKQFIR